MATLPDSDLQTIEHGTQGWNAIQSSNMELLDTKLRHVLKGNNDILGVPTQAANAATVEAPAAQTSEPVTDNSGGTPTTTIGAISGSGADAGINDNFSSFAVQQNKDKADITELYDAVSSLKAAYESLQGDYNAVLTKLRKTTGTGVFGG
jgi:hypothetical protein